MRLAFPVLIGAAMLAVAARADVPTVTMTDLSVTIGTTPVACVPPDAARRSLWIENPGSGNIGYCVGAGCVPAIGAAGTSTLTPGQADFYPAGTAPAQALWCIAAGANAPVTIRSGK